MLSVAKISEILKEIIGGSKCHADVIWTENAIANALWKLAAYGKTLCENELKFLSAINIIYHVLKSYKKEFEEGQRSFF